MFFRDSEQHERHAFIDASIEGAREQFDDPRFSGLLTESVVQAHRRVLDDYLYIPNVRHGEVKLPRKLNNNLVPVLALKLNEEVLIDPRIRRSTPSQIHQAIEPLSQWSESDSELAKDTAKIQAGPPIENPLTVRVSKNAMATVISSTATFEIDSEKAGKHRQRVLYGRPVLALEYTANEPRFCPSVMGHEVEHVLQNLTNPIHRIRSENEWSQHILRHELEAYYIQSRYILGLTLTGYTPLEGEIPDYTINEQGQPSSFAAALNNLRRETNERRKDKFFPNGTLQNLLKERGLDSIYKS